ncbi:hypothetical protein GCM10010885_22670 [Alicyclobacillus cellulosilyticus]|uniref:Spore germination protein n=1 Tax=Alicyclobacillus cellulosilyticus TaxID=1003997 RepID=A0A917KGD1_9BACL|nr:hypothetical protein GCM10010885_22670 [Alicyclobacillus cellulosilyticus]
MVKQRNAQVIAILTFECVLGPGTFDWLPSWIADAKTWSWVPFLIYACLLFILLYILVDLVAVTQGRSVRAVTVFDAILPGQIAWMLNMLLGIAFVLWAAASVRSGIQLIKYVALPNTPMLILASVGMLIPLQLLRGGLDALLRFQTVLFWPALVFGVGLLLLCVRTADPGNLLPLWPVWWHGVWAACQLIPRLLPGVLLCCAYVPVFRWAGVSAQALRHAVMAGTASVLLLQALNLLIVLADLGPFEGSNLNWPIIEVLRMQNWGKLDVIFLLPVLVTVSSIVNLFIVAACRIAVFYCRKRSIWVEIAVLALVVLLCVTPQTYLGVMRMLSFGLMGTEAALLPALVLLWSWARLRPARWIRGRVP